MYNNYPNYYPQIQSQQQRPYLPNLKGRPVSSLDEVRATSVDFDGSLFFFPDIANKKIYTKSINMDGTVNISMYELSQIKANQSMDSSCYITREEFEQVINKMYQEMSQTTAQQQKPQEFKF